MEIIEVPGLSFEDRSPTERVIIENLIQSKVELQDMALVKAPMTQILNHGGFENAQLFINEVCQQFSHKNLLFVSQHIQTERLNFKGQQVLTPHAELGSNVSISIPFFPVTISKKNPLVERDLLFSFCGSSTTHSLRSRLMKNFPDYFFDRGVHGGLHDSIRTPTFVNRYIELLQKSIFSICPRGAGVSTVRIFESISMGAIPVILSDRYSPPLCNPYSWDDFAIFIREDNGGEIKNILESQTSQRIKEMQANLNEVNQGFFQPSKIHLSALQGLLKPVDLEIPSSRFPLNSDLNG